MKICLSLTLILGFYIGWSQEKIPFLEYSEITQLANESARTGDYEKTLEHLNRVHKNDSAACSALVSRSYYLMVLEQYDRALEVIDSGLTKGCGDLRSSFLINKGVALIGKEKYEEAARIQEEALKQYPKNDLLWYNYGLALEKNDQLEKAVRAYQNTILINPLYKKPYLQLGNICYKQEKLSQALMCYNMALFIEPDTDDAFRVLQSLNDLVQRRNENKANPDITLSEDDDAYREIDLVLTNRIALNDNYQTGNPINIALVKQDHAFLETLKSFNGSKGFWAERFVPFYNWVHANGYFNEFIYTLNYTIKNEEYKKHIERNLKAVEEFHELAKSKWTEFVQKDTRNWYDEEKEITFYYNNGILQGIGDLENDIARGPWEFYNKEGRITAIGSFDKEGNREGKWTWFNESHQLKETAAYSKGKLEGENLHYHDNGRLKIRAGFTNGLLEGAYEYYNDKGALELKKFYKAGKLEGMSTSYFEAGGSLPEYLIPYKSDKINGKVVELYSNGKVYSEIEFVEGERHGKDIQYNHEGTVTSVKNYMNGQLNGEIVTYYPDSRVMEKGQAVDGNYEGEWKNFYSDGTLQSLKLYSKGLLTGTAKNFDTDGKLHSEYDHKNGEVIAYRFYDKAGNILKEERKRGGEFLYKSFTPSGVLNSEGGYDIKGGKEGAWKFYTSNGTLSDRATYKEDQINGEYISYYVNGEVSSVTPYKNDTITGYYSDHYKNGQLNNQGWFTSNNKNGEWRSYYIDGTLESVSYYHNGQLHGEQNYFAVDGKISGRSIYSYGEIMEDYYFDNRGELFDSIVYTNPESEYIISSHHNNKKPESRMHYTNGVKHGEYTYMDFSGTKRMEGRHLNGQRHGKWTWYHENGAIERTANYSMGSLHGASISKYENGQLEDQYYYRFGLADSTWTSYHENGNIHTVTEYEDDKNHGRKEFYSPSGELQLIRFYQHGKLVGYSHLDSSGNELPLIQIVNETGTIKAYYSNGKLSREMEYRDGELINMYREYYLNGQVAGEMPYTDGEYHGTIKEYYSNGNLKLQKDYMYGYLHGKNVEHFENGKVKQEENFLNDKQHGPSKTYGNDGTLIKAEEYFNGNVMATSNL